MSDAILNDSFLLFRLSWISCLKFLWNFVYFLLSLFLLVLSVTFEIKSFMFLWLCFSSSSFQVVGNGKLVLQEDGWDYTNTFASASAPALAMKGRDGWKATSKMDSSNFLRWAVISWTHVFVSRFHKRTLQSWPKIRNMVSCSISKKEYTTGAIKPYLSNCCVGRT